MQSEIRKEVTEYVSIVEQTRAQAEQSILHKMVICKPI